jgi:predicted PurR-regulated permease PerM
MWKSLWVSPLVIFICMLLFWTIMWFFGVLLAVPIAVIVSLAFQIPQAKEFNKMVEKSWVKLMNKKQFTRKKLK